VVDRPTITGRLLGWFHAHGLPNTLRMPASTVTSHEPNGARRPARAEFFFVAARQALGTRPLLRDRVDNFHGHSSSSLFQFDCVGAIGSKIESFLVYGYIIWGGVEKPHSSIAGIHWGWTRALRALIPIHDRFSPDDRECPAAPAICLGLFSDRARCSFTR
jgi:hypothetical protein